MPGATSSTVHSITVRRNARLFDVILRRFTNQEWLSEEPDLALHEAENLKKVAQAGVPTPQLIAYDEEGDRCGVPAVLMTRLPGGVELAPPDLDDWLFQLAAALIPIHALDVGAHPWRYAPYNDISHLQVPAWSKRPRLWEKTLEIVSGLWPDAPVHFIHRDYHPNNVVWQSGRISGVIDWPNACRGPIGIDVAWCRANLIGLYDVAVPDRFLQHYQSLAGSSFDYDPFWDLMVIIEGLPDPPGMYPGWAAFGFEPIDEETLVERLDAYLASVIARF